MASVNPYALLDDDFEKPIQKPVVVKKDEKPKSKPTSAKPLRDQNGRSDRKKTPRNNGQYQRKPAVVKEGEFEEKPEHNNEKKVRGGPRRAPAHGRDMDRHSQAAPHKSGEKKEVAGKGSWGDEVEAQIEATPENENDEFEVEEPEKQPEDDFKSLADYVKEKQAAKLVADVNIRKANEGVNDPKWTKLTPLNKEKDEEVFFVGKTANKERKVKEVKAKVHVPIEQTFAPAPRERTERSDRGGRGGRGGSAKNSRGGPKAGGKSARPSRSGAPVNVQDTVAFPTLGGK